MHSVQESFSEPRVPDGAPFYSLQASMQAVTIVYLNRFLDEFLRYLSGLFHLCPPIPEHVKILRKQALKESKAAARAAAKAARAQRAEPTSPQGRETAESVDAFSREAQAAPPEASDSSAITVLLDVEMNAPVIEMPRHSTSEDSLEVDLGVLKLTNSIVQLGSGQTVDVIDVTLQEVLFPCLLVLVQFLTISSNTESCLGSGEGAESESYLARHFVNCRVTCN